MAAPSPTASSRTALLAGATGLIGRELLTRLLADPAYARVHVLLRRTPPDLPAHPKLVIQLVDFAALPALPAVDDVYIALGTTIKVAGSQQAFRRVDHDFVVAIAAAAQATGAQRLAVVSALGADANSRVFYNRVKGDMQADIARLGYAATVFAQPSLLAGDRASLGQPVRTGEVWATRLLGPVMVLVPRGIRPIAARDVAAALVNATLAPVAGTRILGSGDMQGAAGR